MAVLDANSVPESVSIPSQLSHAVPGRQREYISGRICAREALQALGATILDIPIGQDGSPTWPPGFVGSITHSHGLVFAAVTSASHALGLGLDAERIMPAATARELLPLIASPHEYPRLAESCPDARMLTTILFSAKETVFKCLYPLTRRRLDFGDVKIDSIDAHAGRFSFSLNASVAEQLPPAGRPDGRIAVMGDFIHTGLVLPHPLC